MTRPAHIGFPNRERRGKILHIALPILGGMASQNILNLVDAGMVGSLGDVALAATGIGSFANFMAVAFVLGISTGVQSMASRRLGEGRDSETAVALNGGLLLTLVFGIPLSIVLISLAPSLIGLLVEDSAVVAEGTPYLQMRLAAIIGVGINFSFRGYWSAVHMTRFYLRTLLVMHTTNIFLNWVLIFGNLGAPALGVEGAGLATTISIYLGSAVYLLMAWRHARGNGFLRGIPGRDTMLTMLRVSVPSGVQQFLFAFGMTMLMTIVGRIGTAELAAANVLLTLGLVAILPSIALGLSAATLVGNALGRGDPEDAKRWGWNVAIMALTVSVCLAIPAAVFREQILGIFLKDPETLALASLPLLLTCLIISFDALGLVLMNAMLGAGDSRRVMLVSVVAQWVFFLPLAWFVGPVWGYGLLGVWILQGCYRLTQSGLFGAYWERGHWAHIKV